MRLLELLLLSSLAIVTLSSCHYSCQSCSTPDYYSCTACAPNRGNGGAPIYGLCYCDNSSDEDANGDCQNSNSYNLRNKIFIILFISLTLLLAVFAIFVKGMKYFLYKTIEDVQELSLIVLFNMYFPQQFDVFLKGLYAFNISSHTFSNIAEGSLYTVMPDSSLATVDAQNIFGKYRLLNKTANFFGNQFTWMIVFFSILTFAVIIRFLRNWLKKKRDM